MYARTPEAPWIPRSSFGGVAASNLAQPLRLSGALGDPAVPLVIATRFHSSDATHKDNGCYHCPLKLGFGRNGRVTIEWEIELDGHLPGFEYAVGGFRSSSSWERVVVRRNVGLVRLQDVWRRRALHSRVPEDAWVALASLTPVKNRIFVVHYSVFPEDLLSRYTKDLVHREMPLLDGEGTQPIARPGVEEHHSGHQHPRLAFHRLGCAGRKRRVAARDTVEQNRDGSPFAECPGFTAEGGTVAAAGPTTCAGALRDQLHTRI